MTTMSIVGLIVGGLLVWAMGIAVVAALPRRAPLLPQTGALPWLVGTGAFAGAFLVTLVMRMLSYAGIPFGAVTIGVPVILALSVAGIVAWRRERHVAHTSLTAAMRTALGHDMQRGWRILWFALLAWLAFRFTVLLVEVVMKPLYPWDAWIQWATKARVWYELRSIVPFERVDAWFAAGGAAYFDASPNYPATVPLLMVWTNITLGQWDDALMNLPFWQLAVGFCFAVYGVLRANGFGPAGALIGAWMVSSLPLANVHVALAGYADLPMGAYFSLAALAGLRWVATREAGDGLLALLFLAACPLVKVPGAAWALTLVPGLLVALLGRTGIRLALIGFACVGVVLVVLAQTTAHVMGYDLHLDFAPAWGSLGNSFFLLSNWHLLWYGVIGVAILGRRQLLSPSLAPLTMVVGTAFVFLFVVFGFTTARDWVENQTTVNRAVLHAAPLIAVWMLLVFGAWMRESDKGATAPADTPIAAT
jgi:hypothetical protein